MLDKNPHLPKPGNPNTDQSKGLKDGAKCLFAGHSFFIPVAKSFDLLAQKNEFPNHDSELVFMPGSQGSPGGIWRNESFRNKIDAKLSKGDVELFGMTVASGPGESGLDDYKRWMDFALKYNPDTRFFIGQYWIPAGPKLKEPMYGALCQKAGQRNFEKVAKLREAYPDNEIHFINYGLISSEMKSAFHADQLPDIDQLVGLGPKCLYRDGKIGHGGRLMHELCALSWLNRLYGAEIDQIKHSGFSEEALRITLDVIKQNETFR